MQIYHPHGFPVPVDDEERADVLRGRGYTDEKPTAPPPNHLPLQREAGTVDDAYFPAAGA